MKSLRFNGWRRLAAPPLAAWLSACSAHGDANPTPPEPAPSAEAAAVVETAGGGAAASESDETVPAAQGGERAPAGGAGQGGTATAPAAVGGRSGNSAGGAGGTGGAGGAGSSAPAAVGGAGGGAAGSAGDASAGTGGSAGAAGVSGAAGSAATSVTFTQVYAVLMAGCSCHAAGAGGLDLGSRGLAHANLVGVTSGACSAELRVAPGAPDRSVLVHALEHTDLNGCSVPQMPAGRAMLGASELALVRAWIDAGAKDD